MRCVGIICEFNPLHKGHKYLMDSVREKYSPDAVVCVMSGNYVQRGEPAVYDKFTRAKAAVLEGADLVIELPLVYAVNSAAEFAKGGIRILRGLGCIDAIAFGSESGDTEALLKAAELLAEEPEAFKSEIKKHMDAGESYPSAYEKAAAALGLDPSLFKSSNDTLALEYLKQLRLTGWSPEVLAVKRTEAPHASDIRKSILDDGVYNNQITVNIPEGALDAYRDSSFFDRKAQDKYFNLVRMNLIQKSPEEISETLEISEGLENRLKAAVSRASSADELILAAKTKRYTYARISRCLLQMCLGLTKAQYRLADSKDVAYARVLAFNEKGTQVLRAAAESSQIPVITNINKNVEEGSLVSDFIDSDVKATDIYNALTGRALYANSDRVVKPFKA